MRPFRGKNDQGSAYHLPVHSVLVRQLYANAAQSLAVIRVSMAAAYPVCPGQESVP